MAATIDELTVTGQYDKALETVRKELPFAYIQGRSNRAPLVYLVRLFVEVGNLADAERSLHRANIASPPEFWDAAARREKAVLLYEQGEYRIAAVSAADAARAAAESRYYEIRVAYCRYIEAIARLRTGDFDAAHRLAQKAVKAVPKRKREGAFFAPRILYGACLAANYATPASASEENCQRGLQMAQATGRETRDLSLGYLALAEVRLRRGDLAASRDAAKRALELAAKLFGRNHQDVVAAVAWLALASQREGRTADAQTLARQALEVGQVVVGDFPRMMELRRQLEPCLNASTQ